MDSSDLTDGQSSTNQSHKSRRAKDRRRHELKQQAQQTSRQRATNESIHTLLEVVKYLNSVQDGDGWRIEQTYNKTEIDKAVRILNCHEEDIMNASLITMKRLIEALFPTPRKNMQHDGGQPNVSAIDLE